MKVNLQIKKILKEKDEKIRTGTQAVRDILKELQKQVMGEIGQAALGSWDAYYLKQMLNSIEYQIDNFAKKMKGKVGEMLDDMWGKGQVLVDMPLAAGGIWTGFHLGTSVLDAMKDFAEHKIKSLSDDAWYRIKSELSLGILGGKTPQEVAKAIGKDLKDIKTPSVFKSIAERAEVITKTEMGRVFSKATQLRMEEAAKHVDGLEKQWIHAGHPKKARPSHEAAGKRGIHVPVNEPFPIFDKIGYALKFPRDPKADISETIGCGCDHVPYHEDWQ